jgi:Rad3-related DNA helicase
MIPASPADLGLSKPTWRPHQQETVAAIAEAGHQRIHALCAPTGSGKSVIAMALARHLEAKTIILTGTKALQEQYAQDFDVPMAKGRGNFRCARDKKRSAAEAPCAHTRYSCPAREQCAYYIQRDRALGAPICVLNYPFFLAEANYTDRIKAVDLLVCDEGHNLERVLIDFASIEFKVEELPADWRPWSRVSDVAAWARVALHDYDTDLAENLEPRILDLVRRLRRTAFLPTNLGWVLQHGQAGIRIRPLWGSAAADDIFPHAKQLLIMSATLMPATLEACGLDPHDWDWHETPSIFPSTNQPIYLWPITNLSAKSREDDYLRVAEAMDRIIARSIPEKGLIHMASRSLEEKLLGFSKYGPLIRTHTTEERQQVLSEFKAARAGILSSVSMMEGIDMPDDLLRWQIIPKTPFADLGDPVVAARARDNPDWYKQDAICRIIQAAGRGMRHKEDRCSTWILDMNAVWLYNRNRAWWPHHAQARTVQYGR